MPHFYDDTIAAISTAMTPQGIGIVRISGTDAYRVADEIYQSKNGKKLSNQKANTIHYGHIVDDGEIVDEVLVMLMRAPHSYTGEDTVEIDCHGGILAMKHVLKAVLTHGARPAEPGEFTKRAFLNGRIDLSQAEAVMDVIEAKNEYALKSSLKQLKGGVKDAIKKVRADILYEIAHIESALDDPEHISLDGYADSLQEKVYTLRSEIKRLLSTSDQGKIIKEGIKTVIVGKPNAGKSSLLNVLSKEERAIVTDIEGTTRDVLEETINIQGVTLRILDTAGIRDSLDKVEKIGIERAKQHAMDADLILYVVDSSRPLDENDAVILDMIENKKAIVLLNKSDLTSVVTEEMMKEKTLCPIIACSAKEQDGVSDLEELIKDLFFEGEISFNDEIYITNLRHITALEEADRSLSYVENSIEKQMPEDFYSIDLMGAYESLGHILGEALGEDLVNEIFSKFCTGK